MAPNFDIRIPGPTGFPKILFEKVAHRFSDHKGRKVPLLRVILRHVGSYYSMDAPAVVASLQLQEGQHRHKDVSLSSTEEETLW